MPQLKRPQPKRPAARAPDPRVERAFMIYRDMGWQRNFRRLAELFRERWPADAVSHTTMNKWARQFEWGRRVAAYDLGRREQLDGSLPPPTTATDAVDGLRQAARRALTAVLQATSMAAEKPGDLKVLLEAANRALDMAARLEQERAGRATAEDAAAFSRRLSAWIHIARRRDLAFLAQTTAEATCRAAGITDGKAVLEAAVAAVGLRIEPNGEIDDGIAELEKFLNDNGSSEPVVCDGMRSDGTRGDFDKKRIKNGNG